MKIGVCFRAVPDYSRLSARDWAWDGDHLVDTSFIRRVFNCFEESALEIALTLRRDADNGPDGLDLTALTVDGPEGDLFLKHLAALGYDRVVRIECPGGIDLRFNPGAVAELLAAYIQSAGLGFVFLGQQGGEGDNGQTGYLLAENLGWPCLRAVSAVTRDGDLRDLRVTRRIQGATLVQSIRPPAVLIAGHCPDAPYLRVPTLKQKLGAKNKEVTRLSSRKLGCNDQRLTDDTKTILDLQRPPVKPPCVFLEGATAREQALQLYDRYLKGKMTS